VTTEFGQVLFDGARVAAENMIGEPGEGWRLAMTVVSHESEPGELGYVARYAKSVKELERTVRADPTAFRSDQLDAVAWAHVQVEMLRLHVCRRLSERLDGVDHGPGGSIDKLLMTWVEQTVGAAALAISGSQAAVAAADVALKIYLYSRAQSVMGGTSQIQKNIVATRILGLPTACPALSRSTRGQRPARRHPRRGRRRGAHRASLAPGPAQRDQRRAAPRPDQ